MFADILVGLALGAFGLFVCFMGLRLFFFALPIVGFVTGFYIGVAGTRAVLHEIFLSTVTAVIIGLIVGVALGILAYFLWYVGALISAGTTGALIGSGLMHTFGVTSGWVVFLVALAAGIFLFLVAFKLALPIWVVIVNSAMLGAAGAVAGVMLIFDQIDRSDLNYGLAWAAIEDSWFWIIAWAIVAVIGIGMQSQAIEKTTLPQDRWGAAHAT
ncbi:MAG TPA: DUF4203 domain-containing protein [Thermomicrobiales bacterium]|nr:DUF4203 domain-containing protein [Thermomicrobiales bacterium]